MLNYFDLTFTSHTTRHQVEVLVRQLIILGGGFRHQMLTEQVTTALLGSAVSDRSATQPFLSDLANELVSHCVSEH